VFRGWQDRGLLTRGVKLRPRQGRHASGTVVVFSALNRDALAFHRQGDEATARDVLAEATRLEERFERVVKSDWGRVRAAEWATDPAAVFAREWPTATLELLDETLRSRSRFGRPYETLGLMVRAGTVGALHEQYARVHAEQEDLLVPLGMLERSGLAFPGAEVLVRTENLPTGQQTNVERALRLLVDTSSLEWAKANATRSHLTWWRLMVAADQSEAEGAAGAGSRDAGSGEPDGPDDEDLPLMLRLARRPLTPVGQARLEALLDSGEAKVRVVAPLVVR
jgi:hypothetical protein